MSQSLIDFTIQIWKEGDQYIAHAMPLDVMSSGQTPDEARQALDEAVHLFLQTASEAGTLDDILQEVGYQQQNGRWESPSWVAIEQRHAIVGS